MMRVLASAWLLLFSTVICAGDEWVTAGRDAEYPGDLYFVGVGVSERGLDAAKQSAIIEVKKQISVKIIASVFDEQMSLTAGGREITSSNRVESRARLITDGDMQGVEIVRTATRGKLTYALAVLDKKNFISNTKAKIAELKHDLAKFVEGVTADIAAGKIGSALDKLSDAKKGINEILDLRTMLSAAAEITRAEQLNYTVADITALYEKCISSIGMTKTGGDNQVLAVGMAPPDPFVVEIKTADGAPAPMLPVALVDGTRHLADKYTDDNGKAEFFIGEQADRSAGAHSYVVAISLSVSSAGKKFLTAQSQTFTYTVKSNPCFAKIVIVAARPLSSGQDELSKKIIARLSKYDIKNDPEADYTLTVSVSAAETGGVQGLSENNTFIKTDVSLTMSLADDGGKEVASLLGTGKGIGGSLVKSAANGADNVKIDKDLKPLLEKMCNVTTGPKLKIAVFEFENRGSYSSWYDMAANVSDMLITKLINTGTFDVLERSQLDKIMEEKSFARSGVLDEKEAIAVAQLVGADVILVGAANVLNGRIEADARIVDIKSGVARCAMSSSAYSPDDLRSMAADIVGQIKGNCLK